MKRLLALLLLACITGIASASRSTDLIELRVAPGCGSWTLPVGADLTFVITAEQSNIPIDGVTLNYEISQDLMTPYRSGSVGIHNGRATVSAGTMHQPGFVRCKVSLESGGHSYSAIGTAGFEPEHIEPTTAMPGDFAEFWERALTADRSCPLDPVLTPLPHKSTPAVDAYQVSFSVGKSNRRFYGMLTLPKDSDSHPAIVRFPGAGVYAIDPVIDWAAKGYIVLSMGVHAIPNDLDPEIYRNLDGGALRGYPTFNMHDADSYYYNAVIRAAVRAVDFVGSLPRCNGCIATYGGSQGGYLAIAAAALNPSVKFVVANFPAMSDLAGYAHGRAGGWPHMFRNPDNRTDALLRNMSYYDTVNFARILRTPGIYGLGYNDLTCAPTTTYSVFNSITAPKSLIVTPLTGHWTISEQTDAEFDAMAGVLDECAGQ